MPSPSSPSPAALDPRPRGLCVLLVEDDEGDAYLVTRALALDPRVGRVVRAVDGVEARGMLEKGDVAPDVAFIDLQMPRMDGQSLLLEFGAVPQAPFPLVVLTCSTAAGDAARSRLYGALRVVTKPDTVEAMRAVLGAAIDAVCPSSPGALASH